MSTLKWENDRKAEIYVSYKTKRRLRWIAKAQGEGTADALADSLLNAVILERWPMITEHEAKIAKAEGELEELLGTEKERLEAWGDHGHLHT